VFERELEEVGLDVPGVAAALGAAVEAEHQVQRRLLPDAVVGECALVLQLLPGEDEPLMVRRDACKTQSVVVSKNREKISGAYIHDWTKIPNRGFDEAQREAKSKLCAQRIHPRLSFFF